jgi:hypothetical protein
MAPFRGDAADAVSPQQPSLRTEVVATSCYPRAQQTPRRAHAHPAHSERSRGRRGSGHCRQICLPNAVSLSVPRHALNHGTHPSSPQLWHFRLHGASRQRTVLAQTRPADSHLPLVVRVVRPLVEQAPRYRRPVHGAVRRPVRIAVLAPCRPFAATVVLALALLPRLRALARHMAADVVSTRRVPTRRRRTPRPRSCSTPSTFAGAGTPAPCVPADSSAVLISARAHAPSGRS